MKTKNNRMTSQKSRGFTLIELASTLVITGIVIGAVMSGAHLLRGAEVVQIISQMTDHKEAIQNFELKYKAIPGDMPNASNFFGDCGGSAAICNGDGNERILYDATDATDESFSAWLHLTMSNFLSNRMSGIGTGVATIDTNVPPAAVTAGGYALAYEGLSFTGVNVLILAAETASNTLTTGVVSPEFSYTIDKKIDDGMPESGTFRSANGNGVTTCLIDNDPAADTYNAQLESDVCISGLDLSSDIN